MMKVLLPETLKKVISEVRDITMDEVFLFRCVLAKGVCDICGK